MEPSSSFFPRELDEDSFLPTTGASLANIFGHRSNSSNLNSGSLMFTAPKPPEILKMTDEYKLDNTKTLKPGPSSKQSECLLGKVVHVYQFVNGAYESNGKLGFAVMRMLSTSQTKLIIFNALKTTLSSALASKNLEITIQNNYITYYDDSGKNWSLLFANSEDISELSNELDKHNVIIRKITKSYDTKNNGKKDVSDESLFETVACNNNQNTSEEDITNTDKKSLIDRMAAMGQAIFPHNLPQNQNNDSGPKEIGFPTSHVEYHHFNVTVPEILTYEESERMQMSTEGQSESCHEKSNDVNMVPNTSQTKTAMFFPYKNEEIVPFSVSSSSNYNLATCISDSKVNNIELQVSVNRISDKLDEALDKLRIIQNSKTQLSSPNESISNFTTEIYKKLLKEYEEKIQMKDQFISSLEDQLLKAQKSCTKLPACIITPFEENSETNLLQKEQDDVNLAYKKEIEELRIGLAAKDENLDVLRNKVHYFENENLTLLNKNKELMKAKIDFASLKKQNDKLINEIDDIKLKYTQLCNNTLTATEVAAKNKSLEKKCVAEKNVREISTQYKNAYLDDEIKEIMNNMYRALVVKFSQHDSYSSTSIRNIVASVIKETTLKVLDSSPE